MQGHVSKALIVVFITVCEVKQGECLQLTALVIQ